MASSRCAPVPCAQSGYLSVGIPLCTHQLIIAQIFKFQRYIQDFPDGAPNAKGGGNNLLFWSIFPENCVKMKKIEPRGACIRSAPVVSANEFD